MPPVPITDGSGSGSGSGAFYRRLMLEVGARTRPVYVGTTCEHPGPRRLMEYVGEYPGFWAGGASGSGSYVGPRPVYVAGECTIGANIGGGSGSGGGGPNGPCADGGGPISCCAADCRFPGTVYASLSRLTTPANCVDLNGLVLPLYFQVVGPNSTGLTGLWTGAVMTTLPTWFGPAQVIVSGMLFAFCLTPPGGPPLLSWRPSVSVLYTAPGTNNTGIVVTFRPFPTGPLCNVSTDCTTVFPLVFGDVPGFVPQDCQYFLRNNIAGQYVSQYCNPAGVGNDQYLITVTGADPVCTGSGHDPCEGSSGGGSGSGSGSGSGFVMPDQRTLMKYVGRRSRTVWVGGCCPVGSGEFAGPVTVPCESNPILPELDATITVTGGGPGSFFPTTVTYDPASGQWVGSTGMTGFPSGDSPSCRLTLECVEGAPSEWHVTLDCGPACNWGTGIASSGFPLIADLTAGVGNTCAPGYSIAVTFTQP
jgi:hypothetical protein